MGWCYARRARQRYRRLAWARPGGYGAYIDNPGANSNPFVHSPAATIAGTIGLEKYSSSPLYVLNGGLIYGIEAAVYNQGGLLTITNQTSGTIIATATANPAGYLGGNFLTLGVGIRTEYQTAVYN